MISENIKRLRENAGLSQAALARKLGVTRASVNAWEMELSAPTAQYLIALAQMFHTTTDDILGLEPQEQIVLRDMNEQEKRLVYDLVSYIAARKDADRQAMKQEKADQQYGDNRKTRRNQEKQLHHFFQQMAFSCSALVMGWCSSRLHIFYTPLYASGTGVYLHACSLFVNRPGYKESDCLFTAASLSRFTP